MFFFFFKQKTAYEMRISDWSSDVCSSDLPETGARYSCPTHRLQRPRARYVRSDPSIPLRCLRGTGGAVEGVADRGGHPDRTATSVQAGDGQIEPHTRAVLRLPVPRPNSRPPGRERGWQDLYSTVDGGNVKKKKTIKT